MRGPRHTTGLGVWDTRNLSYIGEGQCPKASEEQGATTHAKPVLRGLWPMSYGSGVSRLGIILGPTRRRPTRAVANVLQLGDESTGI